MKLKENKNTVAYTDVSFTCHLQIIENSLKDFSFKTEVEIEGKCKVLIMALVKSTRILGHLFASEGRQQPEKTFISRECYLTYTFHL